MKSRSMEILNIIKELRNLSPEVDKKLEMDGLSLTNIPKEQLFTYNIKSIITAIEAMLRNEPSEKHIIRLEKDIPDSYNNIRKIQETSQGKLNSTSLSRIKELIKNIEQNYQKL